MNNNGEARKEHPWRILLASPCLILEVVVSLKEVSRLLSGT
jgi:hypothetical protein